MRIIGALTIFQSSNGFRCMGFFSWPWNYRCIKNIYFTYCYWSQPWKACGCLEPYLEQDLWCPKKIFTKKCALSTTSSKTKPVFTWQGTAMTIKPLYNYWMIKHWYDKEKYIAHHWWDLMGRLSPSVIMSLILTTSEWCNWEKNRG